MSATLRFLADEDFDNTILRGARRRLPTVDIVRAQDVGLSGKHDTELLAWAAESGRVVLTHDVSTMKNYAYDRVRRGLKMPGGFVTSQFLPIKSAIDAIALLAECSLENEWEGQVLHLPV